MFENRDDNQEQKSEVRQRMEAFYEAMSKDPALLSKPNPDLLATSF